MSYGTAPHRVLVGYDNTSPGKPATQKSTGYGGDGGRAVDGNTDGHFGHGSVTHTVEPEKQAWWQADLGTSTDIGAVALWNRTDCCSGRLKDYYVLVSDQPFTSDSLEETLATPGVRTYHQSAEAGRPTHIPIAETGRYVRIQLKSASDALSVAEVAVYTPVP